MKKDQGEPRVHRVQIRDVKMGNNVTIVKPVNLYECAIGNRSFIGPFVEIQRGVVIGDDCKIQSHSFLCEKVTIGDNCFVSHGAMFINDRFADGGPAQGDKSQWESTLIGNKVSIGTNATILPVRICSHVVIGAGAVVTRDINEPGTYVGNPARRLQK